MLWLIVLNVYYGKKICKDTVLNFKKENKRKMVQQNNEHWKNQGFVIILLMRLLPIAPYNVINYLQGLTEISFVKYTIATFFRNNSAHSCF